jgi:hypothetical protein
MAGEPATVRSDLYSAGVVLRTLTAKRPQPALDPLIEALTAPDPAARPASAAAAQGLWQTGAAAAVTAPTRVVTHRASRRPRAAIIAAALSALAIAIVAVALAATSGSSPSRPSPVPSPAPASAPLSSQLQALGRIVDAAKR